MTPITQDRDRDYLSQQDVNIGRERRAEDQCVHVLHDVDTVPPPRWWTQEKS